MKKIKLKRLWNNLASVRDYIIEDAIKKGENVMITVDGKNEKMIISADDLRSKKFQIHITKFKSRYSDKEYSLIDFVWRPQA